MMTDRIDALVADYLTRVSHATAGLSADRRNELFDDLREHIATGRAELEPETEERVREILERLGDPVLIAQAAADEATPAPPPPPVPAPVERPRAPLWMIAVIGAALMIIVLCGGWMVFAARDSGQPVPEPAVPAVIHSDGAS